MSFRIWNDITSNHLTSSDQTTIHRISDVNVAVKPEGSIAYDLSTDRCVFSDGLEWIEMSFLLTSETLDSDGEIDLSVYRSLIDTSEGSLTMTLPTPTRDSIKRICILNESNSVDIETDKETFMLNKDRPCVVLEYLLSINEWVPSSFSTYIIGGRQQGSSLIGTSIGNANQGRGVAISQDGSVIAIGGFGDNGGVGASWIFNRQTDGSWTETVKLIGTGAVGTSFQGIGLELSANGKTLAVGGINDNGGVGAVWIFIENGGIWTQQGAKLIGSGAIGSAAQGLGVSLSYDGNTVVWGGTLDNGGEGAAWIFTRDSSGVWTEQAKITGTVVSASAQFGASVSLSSDGSTLAVGGPVADSGGGPGSLRGATWIFTRSGTVWTEEAKLDSPDAIGFARQGSSVALNADGNTLVIGAPSDGNTNPGSSIPAIGATRVYERRGTSWFQTARLIGTGFVGLPNQGNCVSIDADGKILGLGAIADNSNEGASWVFERTPDNVWVQKGNKLDSLGSTAISLEGICLKISKDGKILVVGASFDDGGVGRVTPFC